MAHHPSTDETGGFAAGDRLGAGRIARVGLALEMPGAVVIVADFLARRTEETLHISLTGTLGVLLAAKRTGVYGNKKGDHLARKWQ